MKTKNSCVVLCVVLSAILLLVSCQSNGKKPLSANPTSQFTLLKEGYDPSFPLEKLVEYNNEELPSGRMNEYQARTYEDADESVPFVHENTGGIKLGDTIEQVNRYFEENEIIVTSSTLVDQSPENSNERIYSVKTPDYSLTFDENGTLLSIFYIFRTYDSEGTDCLGKSYYGVANDYITRDQLFEKYGQPDSYYTAEDNRSFAFEYDFPDYCAVYYMTAEWQISQYDFDLNNNISGVWLGKDVQQMVSGEFFAAVERRAYKKDQPFSYSGQIGAVPKSRSSIFADGELLEPELSDTMLLLPDAMRDYQSPCNSANSGGIKLGMSMEKAEEYFQKNNIYIVASHKNEEDGEYEIFTHGGDYLFDMESKTLKSASLWLPAGFDGVKNWSPELAQEKFGQPARHEQIGLFSVLTYPMGDYNLSFRLSSGNQMLYYDTAVLSL